MKGGNGVKRSIVSYRTRKEFEAQELEVETRHLDEEGNGIKGSVLLVDGEEERDRGIMDFLLVSLCLRVKMEMY